jgi:serpin B
MSHLFLALGLMLPQVPGTPSEGQAVVTANNQFALDLYRQLQGTVDNVFLSPYSINKTLAMAYAGARGDTAREMAAVLHDTLGPDRWPQAFRSMRQLLNQGKDGAPALVNPFGGRHHLQLSLSANVWGQRGYGFEKSFLNLLRQDFGAPLEEVDFAAPEQARQTINAWVEKQTNRKIQDLFQAGTLDINTRLVLVSAIYFKGDWVHRFQKDKTRNEPFWVSAQRSVSVPLMSQTARFGYFDNDELQGLRMPYEGKDLALLVVLPRKRDGLADMEKTLTAEKLAAWMSAGSECEVDVFLPKFRLTNAFALKETLEALGMHKAFAPGEADLSGMNGGREPLYISVVVHRAFVDVNEEGTEAAAATGAAVGAMAMPTGPAAPVFRADHPFVFAIYNVRTGVVLFLGRFANPGSAGNAAGRS